MPLFEEFGKRLAGEPAAAGIERFTHVKVIPKGAKGIYTVYDDAGSVVNTARLSMM